MQRRNAETKAFIARQFHYDTTYVEVIWPKFQFFVILPHAMLAVFEDQARWRVENHLTETTKMPNYLNFCLPMGWRR
jgi:hypothetical protein